MALVQLSTMLALDWTKNHICRINITSRRWEKDCNWKNNGLNGMVQFLTSSTKMTIGEGFLASEKRAFVSFSKSPNHYKTSGHNPKSINYELGKWKFKCKSSKTRFTIEAIGKWHDFALDWMFDYGGLFLQNITILNVETKRIVMTLLMSKVL